MARKETARICLWELIKSKEEILTKADIKQLCRQGKVVIEGRVVKNAQLPLLPNTEFELKN